MRLWIGLWAILALLQACRKESFNTSSEALLQFSTDTLTFDTVFTDMGSATRRLKIYNPYNQKVLLSRVSLAGGTHSDFRLNIDGLNRTEAQDIEIPAKDSIYIFAQVRIDPNNGDAMRWDSIFFDINGNRQKVILSAYGWNARYIGRIGFITRYVNSQIDFTNDKPYVLFGIVAIDSFSTLRIQPGTQVFMYGGSSSRPGDRALLYIGDQSTLEAGVGGSIQQPVEFKTHRLEEDYQPLPFHHSGIYLSRFSINNKIHNCIIRNGLDGIIVDSLSINGQPKLDLRQTKIYNVERSGILARQGSLYAENVLIANSNNYNVVLLKGGAHEFVHCTFANLATTVFVRRNEAILSLRDFELVYDQAGNELAVTADGLTRFKNCVIYGSKMEEIEVLRARGSTANFDFSFDHCLVKADTFSQNLINCWRNTNPRFKAPAEYNYAPDSLISPLVNRGLPLGILRDLEGNTRDGQPDLGAYEFQ